MTDSTYLEESVHLQVLLGVGLALLCFCLLFGCAVCWQRSRRNHSSPSVTGRDQELSLDHCTGQKLSEVPVISAAVPIPPRYQDMGEDNESKSGDIEDDLPIREIHSAPVRRLYARASLPNLYHISSKTKQVLQRRSTLISDFSEKSDCVRLVKVPLSHTEPSGLSRSKRKVHPLLHFTTHFSLTEETLTVTVTGLSQLPKKFHQKRDSFVRAYLMPGFIEPRPRLNDDSDRGQSFLFCRFNPEQLRKYTLRLAVYAQEKQSLRERFIGEVLFPCSEGDWQCQGTSGYSKELSVTKSQLKKSLSTMDVLTYPNPQPKNIGQIFILLQYQAPANRIKVMVQKAEILGKLTRMPGAPDHFVSIRLIHGCQVKDMKETRSVTGFSPVWNAPFLFDIPSKAFQDETLSIEFVIMQGRVYNRARILGRVQIGFGSSEAGLAHWKEMYNKGPVECARWHALQPHDF